MTSNKVGQPDSEGFKTYKVLFVGASGLERMVVVFDWLMFRMSSITTGMLVVRILSQCHCILLFNKEYAK